MSTTVTPQTPPMESQGAFRARMRATYGDGRNGTIHWREHPAAQAEISARKAVKDQAWQSQLTRWKQQREVKKILTATAKQVQIDLARNASSIDEALRIIGAIS